MMTQVNTEFQNLILVIPEKADPEREAVALAWQSGGGEVLKLGRFWDPPNLEASRVRLYGNDTFCLVLAEKLGLEPISPPDNMLLKIESGWLKRKILARDLKLVSEADFPTFVKSQVPKVFRSGIYQSLTDLRLECDGLDSTTPIIISEIVEIKAEARVFILNTKVQTFALYEGIDASGLMDFVTQFVNQNELPLTCVLDFAFLKTRGWAFLEANPSWGAGLNNCDPLLAARCIAQATRVKT
jgi:ATP-grasp domain, R2K clade family 2